jgi:hypothetical protein
MARVATLAMSLLLAIENLPLKQGVNTAWARVRATRLSSVAVARPVDDDSRHGLTGPLHRRDGATRCPPGLLRRGMAGKRC